MVTVHLTGMTVALKAAEMQIPETKENNQLQEIPRRTTFQKQRAVDFNLINELKNLQCHVEQPVVGTVAGIERMGTEEHKLCL